MLLPLKKHSFTIFQVVVMQLSLLHQLLLSRLHLPYGFNKLMHFKIYFPFGNEAVNRRKIEPDQLCIRVEYFLRVIKRVPYYYCSYFFLFLFIVSVSFFFLFSSLLLSIFIVPVLILCLVVFIFVAICCAFIFATVCAFYFHFFFLKCKVQSDTSDFRFFPLSSEN